MINTICVETEFLHKKQRIRNWKTVLYIAFQVSPTT